MFEKSENITSKLVRSLRHDISGIPHKEGRIEYFKSARIELIDWLNHIEKDI